MWYDDEFLASMYIPFIIYGIPTEPDKIHFDGPCLRINIYNILLLYVLHVWFWKPNLAWCGMIVHADILSLSLYIYFIFYYIYALFADWGLCMKRHAHKNFDSKIYAMLVSYTMNCTEHALTK